MRNLSNYRRPGNLLINNYYYYYYLLVFFSSPELYSDSIIINFYIVSNELVFCVNFSLRKITVKFIHFIFLLRVFRTKSFPDDLLHVIRLMVKNKKVKKKKGKGKVLY